MTIEDFFKYKLTEQYVKMLLSNKESTWVCLAGAPLFNSIGKLQRIKKEIRLYLEEGVSYVNNGYGLNLISMQQAKTNINSFRQLWVNTFEFTTNIDKQEIDVIFKDEDGNNKLLKVLVVIGNPVQQIIENPGA